MRDESAAYPFWSPDSRHIAFFALGKLKRIALAGGPAQSLCDAPDGRGGSWNREGTIVFSPNGLGSTAIQRVSAEGGIPADVTRSKGNYAHPVFLPNGRHFLYLMTKASSEENGVYLSSLDGDENRRVLPDESSVVVAAGRVLFVRENALIAQPIAADGEALGPAVPVAENVALAPNFCYAPVTASDTGVLVYRNVRATGVNQIIWCNRAGKLLGAIGAPGVIFEPSIAPNKQSIVFRRGSASGWDLWQRDLIRNIESAITVDAQAFSPSWSPKGDRIAYGSGRRGGVLNLYKKRLGQLDHDELLLANSINKVPTHWSHDGRFLVYSELGRRLEIWVLPMKGVEREPIRFLATESAVFFGQLSPDSHWMAYTSDESGRREVYVRPFPTGGLNREFRKRVVSNRAGAVTGRSCSSWD